MKKAILIASVFMLLFHQAIAQRISAEEFLNQTAASLVDTAKQPTFYSLTWHNKLYLESSYGLDGEEERLISEFRNFAPMESLYEIAGNFAQDTIDGKWDFSKLTNMPWVNLELWQDAQERTFSPHRNPNLSKNAADSDLAEQGLLLLNRIEFNDTARSVYTFSRPIFDKTISYAVIYRAYHCGMLCGYGRYYLFRREKNRWQLVHWFRTWVS